MLHNCADRDVNASENTITMDDLRSIEEIKQA